MKKETQKILIKKQASPNPQYGKPPEERTIQELLDYGIINLNKPSGPTSHQVADHVKKILNLKKCGHSGTLDPKVTGCLPIAFSKATRIVQYLLKSNKEYTAIMRLHQQHPEKEIKEIFKKFTGEIKQLPPVRSAVKRQERLRNIYNLELLEIKDKDVLFNVSCQAGTYIRKLIHDIGKTLNSGANMTQLVRTKAGPFTDKTWHNLQELKDAYEFYKQNKNEIQLRKIILPFENAISHIPKIWVLDSAVSNLCHGSYLGANGISKLQENIKENDTVAITSLKGELICMGTSKLNSEQILNSQKGLCATIQKVFMERKTYPK